MLATLAVFEVQLAPVFEPSISVEAMSVAPALTVSGAVSFAGAIAGQSHLEN